MLGGKIMKRVFRLISTVICICFILLIFAACGSNSSTQNNPGNTTTTNTDTNTQQEQTIPATKIKYLSARALNQDVNMILNDLISQYKETHPDFVFEIECIADRPAFLQKVKILAASNELPDWFDADPEPFFAGIAQKGLVADIEELYQELEVSDKFFKVSRDYPKFDDGSLNLISWQGNTEYFWYNKDLFTQAGINAPGTFDEFMSACETLKTKGITPIAIGGKDMWPPLRYLAYIPFRRAGNDFIDKLRKGEASMTSDVGIEAAKFVQDIAKNYFMEGWANADYNTGLETFLSGKAAIYYIGTWELGSFVDENMELKENIGYFYLPKADSSDVTKEADFWAHSGIGMAIRKDKLDDGMKDCLKFIFDNYADTALYKYHVIPSMIPTIKDDLPELYKNIINDLTNVNTFAQCWDVRVDPATNEILGKETINLGMGTITPEEYAKRIDAAIQQNAPKFFNK